MKYAAIVSAAVLAAATTACGGGTGDANRGDVAQSQPSPFPTVVGLDTDELVVRKLGEPVSFEVQVVLDDGTPASDYALTWDVLEQAGQPELEHVELSPEHLGAGREKVTVVAHRAAVVRLRARLEVEGHDASARADQGSTATKIIRYWGGEPERVEAPTSAMEMVVGEERPVTALGIGRMAAAGEDGADRYAFPEEGVVWECSDTSVAEIDADGVVRAVSPGEAELRYGFEGLGLSRSVTLTVTDGEMGPPGPGLHPFRSVPPDVPAFAIGESGPLARRAYPDRMVLDDRGNPHLVATQGPSGGGYELVDAAGLLVRWTGSGFGFERVTPPWERVSGIALAIGEDQRIYVVWHSAVDGRLVIADRALEEGPGDWRMRRVPAPLRLDEEVVDRTDCLRGVVDFTVGARPGGGAWVAVYRGRPYDLNRRWLDVHRLIEVDADKLTLRPVAVLEQPVKAPGSFYSCTPPDAPEDVQRLALFAPEHGEETPTIASAWPVSGEGGTHLLAVRDGEWTAQVPDTIPQLPQAIAGEWSVTWEAQADGRLFGIWRYALASGVGGFDLPLVAEDGTDKLERFPFGRVEAYAGDDQSLYLAMGSGGAGESGTLRVLQMPRVDARADSSVADGQLVDAIPVSALALRPPLVTADGKRWLLTSDVSWVGGAGNLGKVLAADGPDSPLEVVRPFDDLYASYPETQIPEIVSVGTGLCSVGITPYCTDDGGANWYARGFLGANYQDLTAVPQLYQFLGTPSGHALAIVVEAIDDYTHYRLEHADLSTPAASFVPVGTWRSAGHIRLVDGTGDGEAVLIRNDIEAHAIHLVSVDATAGTILTEQTISVDPGAELPNYAINAALTNDGDVVSFENDLGAEVRPVLRVVDADTGEVSSIFLEALFSPIEVNHQVPQQSRLLRLSDGRLVLVGSREAEPGTTRVFYTVSEDGVDWEAPVDLRPRGGRAQRLMGAVATPGAGLWVILDDNLSFTPWKLDYRLEAKSNTPTPEFEAVVQSWSPFALITSSDFGLDKSLAPLHTFAMEVEP